MFANNNLMINDKQFMKKEAELLPLLSVTKSLAEFAASAANKIKNTSQAASVEFLRYAKELCVQQPAKVWRKSPKGFFDSFRSGITSASSNPR